MDNRREVLEKIETRLTDIKVLKTRADIDLGFDVDNALKKVALAIRDGDTKQEVLNGCE